MHIVVPLAVLYFGTPVVLVSSRNEDGSTNLAPMSSAWWLGADAMLGLGAASQTRANLLRDPECVLNLPSAVLVRAVNRLALLTGASPVPKHKLHMGYRNEPDKFGAAGLTPQASDLVGPDRVSECPIQLEGRVVASQPFENQNARATTFQVNIVRAHVEDNIVIPGTSHVDPDRWDPLIMKFCEFYGNGERLSPSRLAGAWKMPHQHGRRTARGGAAS